MKLPQLKDFTLFGKVVLHAKVLFCLWAICPGRELVTRALRWVLVQSAGTASKEDLPVILRNWR